MQLQQRSSFVCARGMLSLMVICLTWKGSHASSVVTTDQTTYFDDGLIQSIDSVSKAGREVENATQPSVPDRTTASPVRTLTNSSTSSSTESPVITFDSLNTAVEESGSEALSTFVNASTEIPDVVECLEGRNCTDSRTTNSEHRLAQPTASMIDTAGGFNLGVIAGISALVVVVATLMGVVSFLIYRHFSWNRPQTLSDKFSNDESNYIDDTIFRENSEEMYSLDNDSFLNSLEAMTIQNYWTDHVKHTKL